MLRTQVPICLNLDFQDLPDFQEIFIAQNFLPQILEILEILIQTINPENPVRRLRLNKIPGQNENKPSFSKKGFIYGGSCKTPGFTSCS